MLNILNRMESILEHIIGYMTKKQLTGRLTHCFALELINAICLSRERLSLGLSNAPPTNRLSHQINFNIYERINVRMCVRFGRH